MRVRNIYMNKCFLVTFLLCVISHYSLPAQPDSLLISHKIDSLKSLVVASVDPHVTIPLFYNAMTPNLIYLEEEYIG